jgi:FkbM family methyltransferase
MNQVALKEKIHAMPVVLGASRHLVLSPVRSYFRYFPVQGGKHFLWRNVACHVRWLEHLTTATTLFGSKLHVDPKDDVGRCIYYFGVWIVKDQGSVVSIEGMPRTCDVLKANYKLNEIHNGRIVPIAVWDTVGDIEMFGPSTGVIGTASAIKSRADQWELKSKVTVACAPLCSILTAAEIKSTRIVKVDVEGAEWRVVLGMNELMKNGRDDLEIVLEVNPDSLLLEGQSCRTLDALFRKFGFHPYQIENLYGDLSRISLRPPSRPRRIEQIPEGELSVVIFSRRDVDFL